jgi:UDPglucose 6-dehydrogenase
MTIGFIGLGKLGLPVALAVESKGHKVIGYDINPNIRQYLTAKTTPFVEKDIDEYLQKTKLKLKSLEEVVKESDIVFVAVQTPHGDMYDGANILPQTREDFDYSYLIDACQRVAQVSKDKLVAVISTVLPGTIKREIEPILDVAYTPQFIAMGTVIDDYLYPEFNLIGATKDKADVLENFYKTINDAICIKTDPTTAECIKVSYNTFIT